MQCVGVSSRELKQRIKPEMIELIKQQRLNHLVNGTRFSIKLGRRSGLLIIYHLHVHTIQSATASLVYNSTGVTLTLQIHAGFLPTVLARCFSLFGHIAQMSDESDAKQILTASPLENWRRPPGRPRITWMKTTQLCFFSVYR